MGITITVENPAESTTNAEGQLLRPTLFFRTITFSDGTTLDLDDDDIVVLVGPNNAGKSAALRELEAWVARSQGGVVIASATMTRTGTANDLRMYLDKNAQKSGNAQNLAYGGIGFNIRDSHIQFFDQPSDRHPVASFFAQRQVRSSNLFGRANQAKGLRFT